MYLKTLSLGDIHPYERNPRINDRAVEPVMKSIEKDGYRARIIVDKDGVIIAGHTRYEAMKRLGWTVAEVWIADDMTPEQIADYRIRDNLTADFAEWDFSELEAEIAEMDLDFDMSEFDGFKDIQGGVSDTEPSAEEDDFDEDMPIEPKAKPGDIYQLGQHRLMCGDSTSADDAKRLMNEMTADLVFTDPPYNIASDSKNFAADCSKAMENLSNADWDKEFDIKNVFPVLFDCLSADVSVYICTSHFLASDIWEWMKGWAEHYSYCVWAKPNPMPSLSKRHWTWNTELICYATRGKHTFNFPAEGHALSTWTINKKNGATGHPTEKPIAVPAMAITHSSKPGDIVLDMFGGSGSTLIACEQTGRNCYMMELDPHYVDVIIARWENLTGEKATLLNG